MEEVNVTVTINGKKRSAKVEPRMLLTHFIRDSLSLTGTHIGCDTSQCGSCSVMVDGHVVKSCTLLAVQVDGSEIITVEGLGTVQNLHPMQKAFWEEHGLQCGYCTPGVMMAAIGLLQENLEPSDEEIREGLEGVICRCTGYQFIVSAVKHAAALMAEEKQVVGEGR
ncbi:(2Fe-2S)-binding protein [Oceanobacillus chungangensis]|uniref:Carbon monoxide dehydrogenase n=1 Tax=Oceanobacillus chungangensis TaxID=1229152 RepID=A0A3D8PIA9_9BACI|nr:(2Fe-2S)-binding protein [Oceanobacillus chungangensis]RDW15382.1 carbon monoxide dehydrogenase [Oceanobacillus chungangensis]